MDNQNLNYLSQQKYDEYKKEYEHLINVERKLVQEALKEARAQGDLSENAEYDAARERQGIVEGRIQELEFILDNVQIIESKAHTNETKIGINSTVTFLILDKNIEKTITITGTHDANPFEGKVSLISPLANALIGNEVGAEVEVDGPNKFMIKVLKIEHL
ncbi:transcription elongation factor GreA [Mycoplasmopsis felis]|uniref:transcription elongation factor GreA n=1 Tax=Mycoplasmopsis felis TaxID=33923 RepID=UPI0021AF61C8|nr:transcription elongation factor GreA [Mycoplasmopsis felis]UWV84955.1 transcription elongation factor GreA [Mycoplasmopsis felis]WQQ03796.1 transcription elongation factor GreA [Mycoplasmopsis felis]WQQ06537.1 transcription elongation factor GreA [Mycoplasmopsis felis]WQQ08828.1 transcription elongation factor GreA [Mycoplasmopsis felis]WQQ09306.1 transcription elongation factor GreA [Mycoplasmopsis felis]